MLIVGHWWIAEKKEKKKEGGASFDARVASFLRNSSFAVLKRFPDCFGQWYETTKPIPYLIGTLSKPFLTPITTTRLGDYKTTYEFWSSGYGRRLMFWRLWDWIPPYCILYGHLFTLICCKIVMFLYKRRKINKKRSWMAKWVVLTLAGTQRTNS